MTLVKIRKPFILNRTSLSFLLVADKFPHQLQNHLTLLFVALCLHPFPSFPFPPFYLFPRFMSFFFIQKMFVKCGLPPITKQWRGRRKIVLSKASWLCICAWHFHNYSVCSICLNDCNYYVILGPWGSKWLPPSHHAIALPARANNGPQFTCTLKWQGKSNCNFCTSQGKRNLFVLTKLLIF